MSKGFGVGKLFGCRNIHHPVEVVTQKVKLPVLVVYVVPGKLVGITIVFFGQVLTKIILYSYMNRAFFLYLSAWKRVFGQVLTKYTLFSGQVLTKLCYLGVVDFRKFLFRKIWRIRFFFL